MSPYDRTVPSYDAAGLEETLEMSPKEGLGSLFGEEAQILTFTIAFFFIRDAEMFCETEDLVLIEGSQGEEYAAQLFLRETVKVVALIFRLIDGLEKEMTVFPLPL